MNNKEMLNDLYEAINEENLKRVEYLISQGVNVDKSIEGQELPLQLAVKLNNALMCKEIIKCLKDKIREEKYKNILERILMYSKRCSLKEVFNEIYDLRGEQESKDSYVHRLLKRLPNGVDSHLMQSFEEEYDQ